MTATYQQAGVIYDSVGYTYQGFGANDRPVIRVDIGWTAPAYNQADYDYDSDVGYGAQIAALDPNPGWTDVTQYVSTLRIRRGNDNFLIRNVESGSLTVVFEDPDSRFLPKDRKSVV